MCKSMSDIGSAMEFLRGYLVSDVYTDECRKFHEMAIEALKEKKLNNGWIPCRERLPDIELDEAITKRGSNAVYPVLATTKKRKFGNEEFYITEKAFYSECFGDGERVFTDRETSKLNVIAWQPLPEPYKGEE